MTNYLDNMKYAIQLKDSGTVIDYCDTMEQAQYWLAHYPVEVVDTTKTSKIVVNYTELGGPWGYGHQEESFATYGGLRRCIINLYKWIQDTARTFGPDVRDIHDFFRHCSLMVNDTDKTQWLLSQIDKLSIKEIYV